MVVILWWLLPICRNGVGRPPPISCAHGLRMIIWWIASFLQEVRGLLKPTAHFLLVEPKLHVSAEAFLKTVEIARSVGLQPVSEPKVAISRAQLFAPMQPAS